MRPKVVVAILLAGASLLGVIVLASKTFHPRLTTSSADSGKASSVSSATAASGKAGGLHIANSGNPPNVPAASLQPVIVAVPAIDTNAVAEHEKYVRQRIKELQALSWNNDTESRDAILSEVKNNPDKTIRAAALDAAIQFDDRSVVPPLQQIAAETQDPAEKQNILDAIDYINLPSLSEYLASQPPSTNGAPTPRGHHHLPQTPPNGP